MTNNDEALNSRCVLIQRNKGILIPQCPPNNELEINGEKDYYFWGNASHEIYKVTYDLLFD